MSYWDEIDARRQGERDFERGRRVSHEYDRHFSDTGRAYHDGYESARREEERREELREEERRAEERREHAREEARRADLAMEEYYRRQQEEQFPEEPEVEPEPVVVAMQKVFAEMDTECRNALRDV